MLCVVLAVVVVAGFVVAVVSRLKLPPRVCPGTIRMWSCTLAMETSIKTCENVLKSIVDIIMKSILILSLQQSGFTLTLILQISLLRCQTYAR